MIKNRLLPYPGLRAFEREEAELFFGRDGVIDDMIDKLYATRFLAVLGSSGTGKSSLVKTGLLDGLELGLHPAGSEWEVCLFTPGGSPLFNFATALLALTRDISHQQDKTDAASLSEEQEAKLLAGFLQEGPRSLIEWYRENARSPAHNLMVLVDQFEELFRFSDYDGKETAESFANLLIESSKATDCPIHIVITMRAEYLGSCALIPGLAETVNKGTFLTPRMSRSHCREAIIGPAAQVKAHIDEALVTRILNDVASLAEWDNNDINRRTALARRADQLPLMQHLLNRLWWEKSAQSATDDTITLGVADYERHGGLKGSLDAHGEILLTLFEASDQPVVEALFRSLVQGASVEEAVRRPCRLQDLVRESGADESVLRRIIDAFRGNDCNFLRPGTGQAITDRTVIDLSHESLIRQWSRLSEWVTAEAQAASFWRRLSIANARYRNGESDLLSGLDLANLRQWWDVTQPQKGWSIRYSDDYDQVADFIQLSVEAEEAQKQREEAKNRRNRNRLIFALFCVSIFAVVASGTAFWGYKSSNLASTAADDLGLGLFKRMDEGLVVPVATRYELIQDRERALTRMAEGSWGNNQIEHKRIELLLRSTQTLLESNWIDQALIRADKLELAVFTDKKVNSSLSTEMATLMTLAEAKIQSGELKKAKDYLHRAEITLDNLKPAPLQQQAYTAQLAQKRFKLALIQEDFDTQQTQLDLIDQIRMKSQQLDPTISGFAYGEEILGENREIWFDIIHSVLFVKGLAFTSPLTRTSVFKSKSAAETVLSSLNEDFEILKKLSSSEHQLRQAQVRFSIHRSYLFDDILEDDEKAFKDANDAVEKAKTLFAADSRNITTLRLLMDALRQRAAVAKDLSYRQQANVDYRSAKSLHNFWVLEQQSPRLSQVQNELRLYWNYYDSSNEDSQVEAAVQLYKNTLKYALDRDLLPNSSRFNGVFSAWMSLDPRLIKDMKANKLHTLLAEHSIKCDPSALARTSREICLSDRLFVTGRVAQLGHNSFGKDKWVNYLDNSIADIMHFFTLQNIPYGILKQHRYLTEMKASSGLLDMNQTARLHLKSLQLSKLLMEDGRSQPENAERILFSASKLLETLQHAPSNADRALNEVIQVLKAMVVMSNSNTVQRIRTQHLNSALDQANNLLDFYNADSESGYTAESNTLRDIIAEIENLKGALEEGVQTVKQEAPKPKDFTEMDSSIKTVTKKISQNPLNWSFLPNLGGAWRTLPDTKSFSKTHPELIRKIGGESNIFAIRKLKLPFYQTGELVDIQVNPYDMQGDGNNGPKLLSYLVFGNEKYELDGNSSNIHNANAANGISLIEASEVASYVKFFCLYIAGDDGAFRIIESVDEMAWKPGDHGALIDKLQPLIRPLVVWPDPDKKGEWLATATVHYSKALFHAKLRIKSTGMVEMLDDIPVGEDLPVRPFKISDQRSGDHVRHFAEVDVTQFGILRLSQLKDQLDHLIFELEEANGKRFDYIIERFVALLVDKDIDLKDTASISPSLMNSFAYTLLTNGTHQIQAVRVAERANKLEPDSFHNLDTLGYGYLLTDRIELGYETLLEAKVLMDKADEKINNNTTAELLAHLGLANSLLGQWDEARKHFAKAKELADAETTKNHIEAVMSSVSKESRSAL